MTEREVYDKSGNILTVLDVDGTWFPRTFNVETLRNIPNVSLKSDDIFLCGCPRSGHHWVYEIVHMLLSGATDYMPHSMESSVLELSPDPSLQTLASPRVLTTHVLPHKLPSDHSNKKLQTIYMIRDPKDVAVSWFYFYQAYPGDPYEGSWEDWLGLFMEDKFMWSTWFRHVRSFEHFFSTMDKSLYHIVFYEDLKTKPFEEVQKLATFLEKPTTGETLAEIVKKCTFQNMKPAKEWINLKWYEKTAQYRKGIIGDWKNMFTEEQEEMFNRVYRRKMEGSSLEYHY